MANDNKVLLKYRLEPHGKFSFWVQESMPLPSWVRQYFPKIESISVGRCPEQGEIRATGGHTHGGTGDICIQSEHWNDQGPTATLIHEYEHVNTKNNHGREWRSAYKNALKEWGYPKGMMIAPGTGTLLTLDSPNMIAPAFTKEGYVMEGTTGKWMAVVYRPLMEPPYWYDEDRLRTQLFEHKEGAEKWVRDFGIMNPIVVTSEVSEEIKDKIDNRDILSVLTKFREEYNSDPYFDDFDDFAGDDGTPPNLASAAQEYRDARDLEPKFGPQDSGLEYRGLKESANYAPRRGRGSLGFRR